MKKIIAASLLALGLAGTASADISIFWAGGNGFYNWNAPAMPADPADYVNFGGGSVTAYLIYSTDNIINFDQSDIGDAFTGGNDSVLDSLSVNTVYGDYDNGAELYVGPLQGGYVFLRIVDLSAPGGSIAQYYDSSVLQSVAYNPNEPASQSLIHNTGDPLGDRMISVVPEPSVLAFLGIGAALVGIRRMRRS